MAIRSSTYDESKAMCARSEWISVTYNEKCKLVDATVRT